MKTSKYQTIWLTKLEQSLKYTKKLLNCGKKRISNTLFPWPKNGEGKNLYKQKQQKPCAIITIWIEKKQEIDPVI